MKKQHLHILLIILLSVILYSNTFKNEFAFDDQFFIIDNYEIRSLKNIPSYFLEPGVGNLYRPLRTTLYATTFSIWKLNPLGYHLNAILLHTLISILVYLITSKILKNKNHSLIASLLFTAHPIHTARVANMTASFDLLGILFLFAAIYTYIIFRKHKSRKAFLYSIIFFTLALFSSEEAIIFPIIILLYDLSFNRENLKDIMKKYWVYILPLIMYLIMRFLVLKQIGRTEVYFLGSIITIILSTLIIFLRYIYILIWPINLTVDYNVIPYTKLSFLVILAIIVYILILYAFIKSYKNNKVALFSLGFFFTALLPFSNIFPVNTFMADRYLYIASFGFVLLLVYLMYSIPNIRFINKNTSKVIIVSLITLLIIFYSSFTIMRNTEWKTDSTLFEAAVEKQPQSSNAHNNLGKVYGNMNKHTRASMEYKKAITLNSKNHVAYLNLGTLYGEQDNYKEAIYYINKSIEIFPSYKAYNNLGLIYSEIGYQEPSIIMLKKAIEFNPSLSKAHMDLGTVYAKNGNFDQALGELKMALEINPNIADTHYNLAVLYEFLDQKDRAKTEFKIAYNLEPSNTLFRDKFLKYK
ncbi:MAG: tetratricopeptide repeat protein [Nanoarchaeota archaeon]|nr:tetratricopeptide repeat protein [Nanoarchaeota archaeon]